MDAKGGGAQGALMTRWVELVVALLVVLGGVVVPAGSEPDRETLKQHDRGPQRAGTAWAKRARSR